MFICEGGFHFISPTLLISTTIPHFCSCLIYQARLPNKLVDYLFEQPRGVTESIELVERSETHQGGQPEFHTLSLEGRGLG